MKEFREWLECGLEFGPGKLSIMKPVGVGLTFSGRSTMTPRVLLNTEANRGDVAIKVHLRSVRESCSPEIPASEVERAEPSKSLFTDIGEYGIPLNIHSETLRNI
jgi:hypothetical protein